MMKEYAAVDFACACGNTDGVFNKSVPLAMAYVRDQNWEKPLSACDAMNSGTAFFSLVMPFVGEGAK